MFLSFLLSRIKHVSPDICHIKCQQPPNSQYLLQAYKVVETISQPSNKDNYVTVCALTELAHLYHTLDQVRAVEPLFLTGLSARKGGLKC